MGCTWDQNKPHDNNNRVYEIWWVKCGIPYLGCVKLCNSDLKGISYLKYKYVVRYMKMSVIIISTGYGSRWNFVENTEHSIINNLIMSKYIFF